MNPKLPAMQKGQVYSIEYLAQSGNGRWYRWTCIGHYIGKDYRGQLQFSYRPEAGTGSVPIDDIQSILAVPNKEKCKAPRRLPGAVIRKATNS